MLCTSMLEFVCMQHAVSSRPCDATRADARLRRHHAGQRALDMSPVAARISHSHSRTRTCTCSCSSCSSASVPSPTRAVDRCAGWRRRELIERRVL